MHSLTISKSVTLYNHEIQCNTVRFRLPQQYGRDLRRSGILPSFKRLLLTDVSGQPIGPIFKGQEEMEPIGCPETSVKI